VPPRNQVGWGPVENTQPRDGIDLTSGASCMFLHGGLIRFLEALLRFRQGALQTAARNAVYGPAPTFPVVGRHRQIAAASGSPTDEHFEIGGPIIGGLGRGLITRSHSQ
jgi:hypothetical protein